MKLLDNFIIIKYIEVITMFLGKRIKEMRKKANMSQEELGKILGVSKVSVCHWEKDVKKPSSKNLIELSKILNAPLEYLIGSDSYVVSENNSNYGMMMASEEIEIIKELRHHKNLYEMLVENPKRTLDRIDKNLF